MRRLSGFAPVLALTLLAAPVHVSLSDAAVVGTGCTEIAHRGNGTPYDEETSGAFNWLATRGYSIETDTRRTLARPQVLVHDASLGRITTPHDTRLMKDLLLPDIQAITLNNGGHVLSTVQGIQLAHNLGIEIMMIEIKEWKANQAYWEDPGPNGEVSGFKALHDWIVNNGMQDRIYVGGNSDTGDDIEAFHSRFPDILTFWRTKPGDAVSVTAAHARGANMVAFHDTHVTLARINAFKADGSFLLASRNIVDVDQFNRTYATGLRVFQTNDPATLNQWCAAAQVSQP